MPPISSDILTGGMFVRSLLFSSGPQQSLLFSSGPERSLLFSSGPERALLLCSGPEPQGPALSVFCHLDLSVRHSGKVGCEL